MTDQELTRSMAVAGFVKSDACLAEWFLPNKPAFRLYKSRAGDKVEGVFCMNVDGSCIEVLTFCFDNISTLGESEFCTKLVGLTEYARKQVDSIADRIAKTTANIKKFAKRHGINTCDELPF